MGAPVGNKNAANAKVWRAAIERALDARGAGDRRVALNTLAAKLLDKCEEGDLGALKELGDRLDGKAKETSDINVSGTLTQIIESLPFSSRPSKPLEG